MTHFRSGDRPCTPTSIAVPRINSLAPKVARYVASNLRKQFQRIIPDLLTYQYCFYDNSLRQNCFSHILVCCTRLSPYYYTILNILLTEPSDYTTVEQRVTFAPEETEQVVAVNIATDNIVESEEQFTARLADPSPRVDLNEGVAAVHITDSSSKLLRGTLLWN